MAGSARPRADPAGVHAALSLAFAGASLALFARLAHLHRTEQLSTLAPDVAAAAAPELPHLEMLARFGGSLWLSGLVAALAVAAVLAWRQETCTRARRALRCAPLLLAAIVATSPPAALHVDGAPPGLGLALAAAWLVNLAIARTHSRHGMMLALPAAAGACAFTLLMLLPNLLPPDVHARRPDLLLAALACSLYALGTGFATAALVEERATLPRSSAAAG